MHLARSIKRLGSTRRGPRVVLAASSLLFASVAGTASGGEAPPLASTADGREAPVAPARMCAEWEPAYGTLIRWPLGIPSQLVLELAAEDSLYVLVESAGQENQARSNFASYGVDLDHVRFLYADTYSHWTRDWGPHSVFDGEGTYGITDPWFDGYPWVDGCLRDGPAGSDTTGNSPPAARRASRRADGRGYSDEDDLVNGVLAAEFGCPLFALPAYCTGGNIMVDGEGTAFSTRRMVNENAPAMTEAEFLARAAQYLGIEAYHLLDDPEIHGIQHIDCYAKLLNEETLLIKQLPTWHPEYDCVERLVDQASALTSCYGRPYRIERVECGIYESNHPAAYTNSLILNRKVLVPTFGISTDAAALAVYADAMPGYEVIGIPYGAWYYYDALHCRTMGIFDRQMLRIAHRPLDECQAPATDYPIDTFIDDRSQAGLIPGALHLFWRRSGETLWSAAPLVSFAPDSFRARVPWQVPGATIEYYLAAGDSSGRSETHPRTAPAGFHTFTVLGDPAALDARPGPAVLLAVTPTPIRSQATIHLSLPQPAWLTVEVISAAGRRVARLHEGHLPAGPRTLSWDTRAANGIACPAGLYFIRAVGGGVARNVRCLLLP